MPDDSDRSPRDKVGTKQLPAVDGPDRESLFRSFGSSEDGLSAAAASAPLERHGRNRIRFHRARSPWLMLAHESVALFPLLLLGASCADRPCPRGRQLEAIEQVTELAEYGLQSF